MQTIFPAVRDYCCLPHLRRAGFGVIHAGKRSDQAWSMTRVAIRCIVWRASRLDASLALLSSNPRKENGIGSVGARYWAYAVCLILSQHQQGATRDSSNRLPLSLLRHPQPLHIPF